jgi:hypothetical protein
MSVAYGINKLTTSVATSMKKKQILTAFLDKYTKLLDKVCVELENDINIATIITVVNSIKKRNPKLIIELWYKNVAIKFREMNINRDNFTGKAIEFVQVIQGDTYFSESVRISTENLYSKLKEYIYKDASININFFEDFETVVKLADLYHSIE